ncbi:MAG: Zn-dependent protease [Actinomycetia bacterium]|nr:Zn-dependent protease [Actinomycetes bacterium]
MKTRDLITYRVGPESQPELWRFIRDTADRLGVAAPDVVELYPVPDVELARGRLLLGLPYVLGLDADGLADVIAHELTYQQTRQGWVVSRLPAQTFCPESVASALLRAAHIAVSFERFVLQYTGPLATAGYYPVDLWDGWRWTLRQKRGWQTPSASVRPVPLDPSGPAAAPAPADDATRPVPLRPLGITTETGFARLLAEEFMSHPGAGQDHRLRPVTFDEVPHEVWDSGMNRQAVAIRTAAAWLMRQSRVTASEVLDLVADGRAAEILHDAGVESPDLDPAARTLGPLVHEALRRRMYRFEHPLRQHVYVGPAWDRIDVAELLESVEQPNVLARLAYLLT